LEKKTPQRMCIVCRAMKGKGELLRVALSPDGIFSVDERGKMPGRGAYVCLTGGCVDKLTKSRALNRAYKREVSGEIYKKAEEVIKAKSDCKQ